MEASESWVRDVSYPVKVELAAATDERNRLTTFFRFFLAIPHLLLVGGPVGFVFCADSGLDASFQLGWGTGGLLGMVACLAAVFSWLAIMITGGHPDSLRNLAAFYLRWRARAIAYMALLRDEYPPFGDGQYPVELKLEKPAGERDRVTVFLRLILALPHIILLWPLGIAWAFTTAFAWIAIMLTGRYPRGLYGFAIGMLSWSIRVEAYLLLLTDDYPPFTLRA